jgi:hypothetical protein
LAHYLNHNKRNELLEKKESKGFHFPKRNGKVLTFVNLAIHPYDWHQVYSSIRNKERVSYANWEAVKGVILALLVLTKRKNKESGKAVDSYVIDFIELIRSDRQGDAEKFLLNMRFYMPRFLFIVGLQVSFGIDWRTAVCKALEKPNKPQPKTYGALFVNPYLRSLLYAYVIYKQYKQAGDEDYEAGVNDTSTLLDLYSKKAYAISREVLQRLFVYLQESLPAYSAVVRRQASYAIDNAIDGWDNITYDFQEFNKKHQKAAREKQDLQANDYNRKLNDDTAPT